MADKKGKAAFFDDDEFNLEQEEPVTGVPKAIIPEIDPAEDLLAYAAPVGTQGRKGQKAPRMNLAIPENIYEIIRRESHKRGMTYSEFLCALVLQWKNNSK